MAKEKKKQIAQEEIEKRRQEFMDKFLIMKEFKPQFYITEKMEFLVKEINELLGRITATQGGTIIQRLRHEYLIRSIHATLAIDGSSLSLQQVSAIVNEPSLIARPIDLSEVINAYSAYELMPQLNPLSVDDLLKVHGMMMQGLVRDSGCIRDVCFSLEEELFDNKKVHYRGCLSQHVSNLFSWYQKSEIHPLIKSAIIHFEFKTMCPFSAGNDRIGRMWHKLLLGNWKEVFFWLPFEEQIQFRQPEYHVNGFVKGISVIRIEFVELMLVIIRDSLQKLSR